jgi:antitoxin component YwqK of YwqJK toxin-antitoxin module
MKKLLLLLLCVPLIGLGQNGLLKSYDDDGRLISEINYKNGILEGLSKYYHYGYRTGQFKDNFVWEDILKETGNYINGMKTGVWKEYREDGTLQWEYTFVDNKREGVTRGWHDNGQLKYEKFWKDGKRLQYGSYITNKVYHENGQLYQTYKYEGSKMVNKEWYENGILGCEINYKDDVKDGLWRFYNENGQLEEESTWENGELISKKCWKENGKEIECPCYDEYFNEIECE